MDNTKLSRMYDPARDSLVVVRDMLVGDRTYVMGDPVPVQEFTEQRLRTLIRSRYVKVIFADREPEPVVETPVAPVVAAPEVITVQLRCEFPGCKKPGPFATKAALGAHKRVHK